MNIVVVSTSRQLTRRWRNVDYAGKMVEEPSPAFSSIETAVAAGPRWVREGQDGDAPSRSDSLHRGPR